MSNYTWRKKRSKEYLPEKNMFYIFCEGNQTEPNYFAGLKKAIELHPVYRNMVSIEITPCSRDTLRVLQEAEKYTKEITLNMVRFGASMIKMITRPLILMESSHIFLSTDMLNNTHINKPIQPRLHFFI